MGRRVRWKPFCGVVLQLLLGVSIALCVLGLSVVCAIARYDCPSVHSPLCPWPECDVCSIARYDCPSVHSPLCPWPECDVCYSKV